MCTFRTPKLILKARKEEPKWIKLKLGDLSQSVEKQNNQKVEEQLMEMVKEREKKDKILLHIEVFIGVLALIILLSCVFVASFAELTAWIRIILIVAGVIPFLICVAYAIRLEQIAGYYECEQCHHKYVPTYSQVFFAMHSGRTRYMKCPKCGKKSWQKKVISK